MGDQAGKCGIISTDDGSGNPYKVTFENGKESSWLEPDKLRSSGCNGRDAFDVHARELLLASNAQVQQECSQLTLKLREALAEVRDRVTRDELPLLSLLQAEPLQLQSSHLSFQEYFAACALCEKDTVLSGSPPWQWPAWWANALTIGEEMGTDFGMGLLRAAGVKDETLDLTQKLGGDRTTALRAVAQMLVGLKSLK